MFRPMNFISNNKNLKFVFEALLNSFKQILNIFMLVFIVWLIFGVMGIFLFSNNFGYCETPNNFDINKFEVLINTSIII